MTFLNQTVQMKKSRFLLLGGLFLLTITSYSQDYAFKVLANKGANEYKSGSDGWQPIKTGASLKSGDELKVSENAYLGLVSVNGKPLELKQAGPYKVADLAAKVGGTTSVLNKYTDFILSSNSAEAKKNRLSATGGITRGDNKLNVFLPQPQNASIFGKEMVVEWEAPAAGGPYIVTVKNIFDEELVKIETPETLVRLNLNDPKLANESAIMLEVSSKAISGIKSDAKVIKKLSPADFEKIKKSYAEISGEVTTDSGFSRFLQAGFYEQHGLLIDALTSYEDAIKLSPDVDDFKLARDEFLYRNKFKKIKN
ncbi:hypothetical protein BH09BAC3_BH09BAC3_05140 [soil metagenome]